MHYVGYAEMAAAVSNAGGLGTLEQHQEVDTFYQGRFPAAPSQDHHGIDGGPAAQGKGSFERRDQDIPARGSRANPASRNCTALSGSADN